MRFSRFFIAPFLLFAALWFAVPATALTRNNPISVSVCNPQRGQVSTVGYDPGYYPRGRYMWPDVYGNRYYQRPITRTAPVLSIDYVNVSQRPITSIEFGLIARGQLVAEVRDVGTFSPGAEIKHRFGISPNVFPLGTGLPRCVALRARYEDGSKWMNPHLPALQRALYGQ